MRKEKQMASKLSREKCRRNNELGRVREGPHYRSKKSAKRQAAASPPAGEESKKSKS